MALIWELLLTLNLVIVVRSCYYQLCQLQVVSDCLSHDVILTHALTTVAPYLFSYPRFSTRLIIVLYCIVVYRVYTFI